MKKSCKFFAMLVLGGMLVTNANALQVNLQVADDIKSAGDSLNLSFTVYRGDILDEHSESMNLKAIALSNLGRFMDALNRDFSTREIVDHPAAGHFSVMSFGYRNKDNLDIFPLSCQNIRLANRAVLNVLLSETGCKVD